MKSSIRAARLFGSATRVLAALAHHTPARPGPALPVQSLHIHVDIIGDAPVTHTDGPGGQCTPTDWVSMVRREADELAVLADYLYGVIDLAGLDAEVTEDTFVRLDDLRWLLGNYVLKGGRIRRLCQLPDLVRSIDMLDQSHTTHTMRAVGDLRATGSALLQRIKATNMATADWLVSHRVALPDPDYLDSNALLGRLDRLQVDPTSVSGDPLYLLTCHVHDVLETVESLGDVEHPVLEVLETQLAKILTTVEDEIASASAFNAALILVLQDVRSTDAA